MIPVPTSHGPVQGFCATHFYNHQPWAGARRCCKQKHVSFCIGTAVPPLRAPPGHSLAAAGEAVPGPAGAQQHHERRQQHHRSRRRTAAHRARLRRRRRSCHRTVGSEVCAAVGGCGQELEGTPGCLLP